MPGQPTFHHRRLFAAWWAIVVIVPQLQWSAALDSGDTPKRLVVVLGTSGLLWAWLVVAARARALTLVTHPIQWPLLVTCAWCLVPTGLARAWYPAWSQTLYWLACALWWSLSVQWLDAPGRIERALQAVALATVGVAALGLAQHLLGLDWPAQAAPPAATYGNRDMAAQVMVVGFPVVLRRALSDRQGRLAGAAQLACVVAFTVFAAARSAWLAMVVQTLGLVAFRVVSGGAPWGRKWWIAGATAAAVAMVVLAPGGLPSVVKNLTKEPPETRGAPALDSIQSRLLLWRNSIGLVGAHPLVGVGPDNFQSHHPDAIVAGVPDPTVMLHVYYRTAHNDWLQLTIELGLPGLGLLLWAGLRFLRAARDVASRDAALAGTIVASFAGYAVDACFTSPTYRAVPPFLLATLLAVLCRSTTLPTRRWCSRPGLVGAALVSGAASVVLVAIFVRWSRADVALREMEEALASSDPARALAASEVALAASKRLAAPQAGAGIALLQLGRADEAVVRFRAYDREYPSEPRNLYHLAEALKHVGGTANLEEAIGHLDRALRVLPRSGTLLDGQGQAYVLLGRLDRAEPILRRAADLDGGSHALHNHAFVLYRLGQFDEAVERLRRATHNQRAEAITHALLGEILVRHLGRADEGKAEMRTALALDPNVAHAEEMRALLR